MRGVAILHLSVLERFLVLYAWKDNACEALTLGRSPQRGTCRRLRKARWHVQDMHRKLNQSAHTHTVAVNARALGLEEARALVGELSAALAARELQLERKQQEVAGMQDVQQRLMVHPRPCPEVPSRRKLEREQQEAAGMQDGQLQLMVHCGPALESRGAASCSL